MGISSAEPYVRRLFEWYGPISHRYRWALFIGPIIFSAFCSIGLLRLEKLRVDDPAYMFTPSDARWRHELQVFTENWPLNENKFLPGKSFETKRFVNILIKAKDGGSIMRDHILKEIQILNEWISYNISVPTKDRRFNLTYQDLCLSYDWVCTGNEHVEMLLKRNKVKQVINLSYPRGGSQDTPVYLGTILGDVTLFENNTIAAANITQLFYFLKQEQTLIGQYSNDFSYAVERFLKDIFTSELIILSFAHYQSLQDGLDENAQRFSFNFIVSFITLSVYALVCAFCMKRRPKKGLDWIRSKPWCACAGLATTLLSIVSSFGLLLLLGVSYNVINTIIPFLIIAIGIDDMFIMNACWTTTDDRDDVPKRMSETLAHAGVAVTITNVTDIMSFAIGCITNLPGIQLFCLYACVSVMFSYIYQITFFCGVMAMMGEAEKEKRHCIFLYKTVQQVNIADLNKTARMEITFPANMRKFQKTRGCASPPDYADSFSSSSEKSEDSGYSSKSTAQVPSNSPPPSYQSSMNESQTSNSHKDPNSIAKFFGRVYGPLILSWPSKLIALVLFVGYLIGAIYGCINFREGLNPGNLVTNDHYIARYFEDIKLFWKSGSQLHVAIIDPPKLSDPIARNAILNVVKSLENTPYTMGREATVFFLLEYYNYLDELNVELENTDKLWNQKLKSWLKFTGGATNWKSDIVFNETTGDIQMFRLQVGLKNIVEPNDHKYAAKLLREIADRQPLKVEIYYEAFPFADQYLIILPSTIQNILISLLCMSVVSFLMVPSLPSGVIIFISIISICVGVFGYMTLWGVNLDAVSMISLIMSIGFAVDLSAHTIYAFVTAHGNTYERVLMALETLGWPIFQGASSTIAGISVLYSVNAYIIQTFFKTIWLTMSIGVLHGLFFIPIFISIFPVRFFKIPKTVELH